MTGISINHENFNNKLTGIMFLKIYWKSIKLKCSVYIMLSSYNLMTTKIIINPVENFLAYEIRHKLWYNYTPTYFNSIF